MRTAPQPLVAVTPAAEWITWLGVVWVWFFLGLMLSQPLPNNGGLRRYELLPLLPFSLLDAIDPPVEPTSPPRGLAYLGERLPLWGVAAVIGLCAWSLGWGLLGGLRGLALTNSERHYFAVLLGLGCVAVLTLACGACGWLSTPLFWCLHIGAGTLGAIQWWRSPRPESKSPAEFRWTAQTSWIAAAILPFLIGMVLGSCSPSTDFDVNEYHLGGPKEWFLAGRIEFLEHNVYTSFPFLTEMLLLDGMVLLGDWFHGALAGQVVLMVFAPLTAAGIWLAGRRWFSERAGVLGAVIYLSTPWVFRMSIIAYAEGGLTAYVFGATLAALLTWDRLRGSGASTTEQNWKTAAPEIALCGLCAGGAMASKYTGLVMAVAPWTVLLCWGTVRYAAGFCVPARSNPRSLGWRLPLLGQWLAVYFLAVGVLIGPWLLKNLIETGNPVYPLGYRVFGGRDLDAAWGEKWSRGHARPSAGSLLGEVRDLGLKAFDVAAVNDWQSPLVFAFAPLAWLWPGERRQVAVLWGATVWLFLAWWLFTHHLDRFWLPLLPAAALLAGVGVASFPSGLRRNLAMGAVSAGWCFNLGFVSTGLVGYNAGLTSLDSAADLAVHVSGPDLGWMNSSQILGNNAKVLCVGEAALFHARFPYVYNTVFDRSIFEDWLGAPGDFPAAERPLLSSDDLRRRLADRGITHVYVNWGEILRYRHPYSYGYTDFVHPSRFADLVKKGILDPPVTLPAGRGRRIVDPESPDARLAANWAPELLQRCGDEWCLTTSQLYPVHHTSLSQSAGD